MKRKITEDDLCALCGKQEDGCHILFNCPAAKCVWERFPAFEEGWSGASRVVDVLDHVLSTFSKEDQLLWAHLCWGVWNGRNKRVFDDTYISPELIVEEAGSLLAEFKAANDRHQVVAANRQEVGDMKWKKPGAGMVKINADAAVSEGLGCGVGIIARNKGEVVFGGAKPIQDTPCPELAEAEGVLRALRCGLEQGLTCVVVESDCLALVEKLKRGTLVGGQLGIVLNGIRGGDEVSSLLMVACASARELGCSFFSTF